MENTKINEMGRESEWDRERDKYHRGVIVNGRELNSRVKSYSERERVINSMGNS